MTVLNTEFLKLANQADQTNHVVVLGFLILTDRQEQWNLSSSLAPAGRGGYC